MATKPLFEHRKQPVKMPVRCQICLDSGIVFLVERAIVGITDLLANSMPCTCVAGDAMKPEYADAEPRRREAIPLPGKAEYEPPDAAELEGLENLKRIVSERASVVPSRRKSFAEWQRAHEQAEVVR